ncbi:hypothetical protein I2492_15470 [Budviciaceae bacterium CWB-B4]|uniref:Uncharacterized protein n=1 Tax=Limnobaculum xujianqingii TaxID=2738837 RepID=A0A9D7AKS9_9GAMM|nr:hypothetical protein [Limnobaculum xujianqingii]MBK5074614.1 hypothetical protein [Limnobaculum xujianqingii]MBK5177720.1 hypothetical protein [Limnobaculum xujianqingii]
MVRGYLVSNPEGPTHKYLCDDCVGSYEIETDEGKANEDCEDCGENE